VVRFLVRCIEVKICGSYIEYHEVKQSIKISIIIIPNYHTHLSYISIYYSNLYSNRNSAKGQKIHTHAHTHDYFKIIVIAVNINDS